MPARAYLREAAHSIYRFFSLLTLGKRELTTGLRSWHSAGTLCIRIRGMKTK